MGPGAVLEMPPKGPESHRLTFEEQIALAVNVVDAQKHKQALSLELEENDNEIYAGSSMIPEYTDDELQALKQADQALELAMREFDEQVDDKREFVEELRDIGKKDLAKEIVHLFNIHKDNIFTHFFHK